VKKPGKSEIYRPWDTRPDGSRYQTKIWWLCYFVRGQRVRVSSRTDDYDEACRQLAIRKGEQAAGIESPTEALKCKVARLLKLVVDDYKEKERSTATELEQRVKSHLMPFFGKHRASDVTTDDIARYKAFRKRDASAATINKELAYLRRAYHLGMRRTPPLVRTAPFFEMLPVDNAREGFVTWEEYAALKAAMPERLRLLFVLAFHSGCRRGELLQLEWSQVDFKEKEIRLRRRQTKSKYPRTLPFYGDMEAEILAHFKVRGEGARVFEESDQRALKRRRANHRHDTFFGKFRLSWNTACEAAGLKGLLFHDLRRTAVRHMIQAGIDWHVVKAITGHKTDSILERYDIVDPKRIRQAREKMQAQFETQAKPKLRRVK
jgi:integrase